MDYTDYTQVPWYRKSWANNLFIVLALVGGCLPLAFWTCFNLLTGDVYFNKKDSDGQLKKWGIVNKILAVLFAIFWTFIIGSVAYNLVTGQR